MDGVLVALSSAYGVMAALPAGGATVALLCQSMAHICHGRHSTGSTCYGKTVSFRHGFTVTGTKVFACSMRSCWSVHSAFCTQAW